MSDQVKNALIGLFVLSALALLGFTLLFLHPQNSDEKQTLLVRFSNIDKISIGTRVTFAGKPVGQVVKITEIDAPRTEKYFGDRVYCYELLLAVDSAVEVYNSDEVSLRTSGLLGERSVAISPHKPKRGIRLRRIGASDLLYATEVGSLEETFAEFNSFAERAEETFDALMDMLEDVKQHNVWEYIGKTAENLSDITTALNSPDEWAGIVCNFHTLSDKALALTERINDTWQNVDETFQNVAMASSNFVETADDFKTITSRIAMGEGSLGKLLLKDELYLQIKALLNKGQTIADDITHYGLLFHNDLSWQRLRARRMNLALRLRQPQEFQNFFEKEVNQVSTSLTRLTLAMEQNPCGSTMQGRKIFAELLRRIESLAESIKLYNEQLVDLQENPL